MLNKVTIQCIYFLSILICIPSFSYAAESPAINNPGARVIMNAKMVSINNRFPTLSFVSIGLGEHINLLDAEYLLGKAVNSSGPIQVGRTRVEQITFTYGAITTIDNHISTIKVYPRIINGKDKSADISYGFGGIGRAETEIKKHVAPPNTIVQNDTSVKTLVYTNTVNYVLLDIDNNTGKVISYEVGFEQAK